jgi:hypothetical protein
MMLACPDCQEPIVKCPLVGAPRADMYAAFARHGVDVHQVPAGAKARDWGGRRGLIAYLGARRQEWPS